MIRPGQTSPVPANAAPADARPRPSWPAWKKVLAYAALAGLAGASIWYIDLRAHRPDGGMKRPELPTTNTRI